MREAPAGRGEGSSHSQTGHSSTKPTRQPQRLLVGDHPELGRMYAAIDPAARFTVPELRPSRLGARLAPYRSEQAARAALEAAGAMIEGGGDG